MAANSKIEWTESTLQLTAGCEHVHTGCDHCYAERMAWRLAHSPNEKVRNVYRRVANIYRGWTGKVIPLPENLDIPFGWKKPRRIFCNSMSDLFHKDVPFDYVDRVFAVMALCQHHTFIAATKRPERAAEYFATRTPMGDSLRVDRLPQWYQQVQFMLDSNMTGIRRRWDFFHANMMGIDPRQPLPNLILLYSASDQQTLDDGLPHLLECPAAVRGLSLEPLVGPVDLSRDPYPISIYTEAKGCKYYAQPEGKLIGHGDGGYRRITARPGISWVIGGGETGPGARPCHPDWVRSIRDQCQAAGVPFFFKGWGEWAPAQDNGPLPRNASYLSAKGEIRPGDWVEMDDTPMIRVGKKRAGRLLDGLELNEFPKIGGGR